MRVRALVAAMILAAIPDRPRTVTAATIRRARRTDIRASRDSGRIPPTRRSNVPDGVNKEFYTAAEFADIVKRAEARQAEQTEPGTVADVHYDFSQFGLDRGQGTVAQKPPDLADRRSADRKDSAADRGSAEARRRSRRREKSDGRSE